MKKSRKPDAQHSPKPEAAALASPPVSTGSLILAALLVVAVTFAVYVPSLDNGFTNWDDGVYVLDNPLLVNPDLGTILRTPVSGNYHPLTILTLAWNYKISGLNAGSYHWVNLILHLANTALVFVFVWMLSRGRLWTAVATSLIFGIHPMHVESVAWVTERKDVLYTFFYLLGLIAYLRYLERRAVAWLGAGLVMIGLSLASKPAAVVFPVALLAIDYFRERKDWTRAVLEKAPFFALSLAGGILTLKAQSAAGAVDPSAAWGFFDKLLLAAYGSVMYVVKFLAPFGLSALYPYPRKSGGLGAAYFGSLLLVVLVVPAALYALRRVRPLMFGVAFYVINIILVLQFVSVGQAVIADRYTYVPYIGLSVAVCWWLDERRAAGAPGRGLSLLAWAFMAVLVPVCLYQTWIRVDVWKDSKALWTDAIAKVPSAIAHNNLGSAFTEEGQWDQAMPHFQEAVRLDPFHARAHNNLGLSLVKKGRGAEAIEQYREALRIEPAYASARKNLGLALAAEKRFEEAIVEYREAIRLEPDNAELRSNLGIALVALKRFPEAIQAYREAIERDPKGPNPRHNLGLALSRMGRLEDAVVEYREAIRIDRNHAGAHFDLASTLGMLGKREEAIAEYREAIRSNEAFVEARVNLAATLAIAGRFKEAIPEMQRALELAPNNADARHNLELMKRDAARK
jgi:tetratricopeptide (TPR) repeat protein